MNQPTTEYPNPNLLADTFRTVIREWFAGDTGRLNAIDNENEHYKIDGVYYDLCATHNYCDANDAMVEAWERVGVNADILSHIGDDETACEIWSEAGDIAKRKGFAKPKGERT